MGQIAIVNGRVSDELLRNSWVKKLEPQSSSTPAPSASERAGGGKASLSRDSFSFSIDGIDLSKSRDLTSELFSGKETVGTLTDTDFRKNEGRTLVNNKYGKLTLTFNDPNVRTASDARKSAKGGAATHAFLYQTADCLTDAAKDYSVLGENEDFRCRVIYDDAFVQDTLDFFTGGTYTSSDTIAMKQSIDAIVFEMADQVKQGKEPDINQVKNKLNVAGTEISLSELFEYQKVGRALEDAIDHTSAGTSITAQPAKKGVATSFARYYGSTRGDLGAKFSDAIQRLYEKNRSNVQDMANRPVYVLGGQQLYTVKTATETGIKIADMFSKMNTSSKSAFQQDFKAKLSQAANMTIQHWSQYGVSASQLGLASNTADTMKYFQELMDTFG